jgi:hypothetical protein
MEVFIRHVTETFYTGLLTGRKCQEISGYECKIEVTCEAHPASAYNSAINVLLIAAANFNCVIKATLIRLF